MAKRIEVPGQGIVEFPDTMSDDEIVKAIKRHTATKQSLSPANSTARQVDEMLGQPPGTTSTEDVQRTLDVAKAPAKPRSVKRGEATLSDLVAGTPIEGPQPGLFGLPRSEEGLGPAVNFVGDLLIPRSVGEAGFMVGTAGYGPAARAVAKVAPYLAKLPMSIGRIILGAIGDEAGSTLTGEEEGGLARGGIAAGIGEAIPKTLKVAGKVGGVVARKLPGVGSAMREAGERRAAAAAAKQQTAVATPMAAEVGGLAGRVAPPMRAETAQELATMGAFPRDTRRFLGRFFDQRLTDAEAIIGPEATIRVPILAKPTGLERTLGLRKGEDVSQFLDPERVIGGQLPGGERMTLREATDKLKDVGFGVWRGRDGTVVPLPKLERARMYGQAKEQIESELRSFAGGGEAVRLWNEGRHAFSAGNALLGVLKVEKVFDRAADVVELNPMVLQRMVRKHAQTLKDRLAPDEWRELQRIVFRGRDVTKQPGVMGLARGGDVFNVRELGQVALDVAVHKMLGASTPTE